MLAAATATQPQALERVQVSPDGRGFVLAESGKPFHPWGLNYGNAGRLIEDYWETDWQTVEGDFREMKAMGANVARVHLQLGKFMSSAEKPNERALERLGKLLGLAERTGIYLDLTGLACYRKADVPAWYDGLAEQDRWAVQSRFWGAVAAKCAESPAVFCYDLINEPLVPGERRRPGDWYSGKPFGGYDFLQFITLDPAGRPRERVVHDWIRTLTAAIRQHDRRTMITVGQLPSIPGVGPLLRLRPGEGRPGRGLHQRPHLPGKGEGGRGGQNAQGLRHEQAAGHRGDVQPDLPDLGRGERSSESPGSSPAAGWATTTASRRMN